MTTLPPPLDPRDRGELAAWTTALAQRYSAWRPAPDGSSDPGSALIGIAARFAELVVERLNRAPDRAHLAFLDLIGERPTPARPARVPVTFTSAEGSPAGVPVPARTPVSAPGGEDRPEGVTYETDEPLVLSPARLRAVVVTDPVHDTWTDVVSPEGGGLGAEVSAFTGATPVVHALYVEHPMLASAAPRPLTVVVTSPPDEPWVAEQARWSRWDGAGWTALAADAATVSTPAPDRRVVRQRFPAHAGAEEGDVEGVTGHWLRAELTVPLTGHAVAEPPTAVAVGRRPPEPFAQGLAPFGVEGQVKWFYLSVPRPPESTPGTRVRITFAGARWGRPGRGRPAVLNWTYRVGETWRPIGRSWSNTSEPDGPLRVVDTTRALTRTGDGGGVTFTLPPDLTGALLGGVDGHWLRVEVDQNEGGGYDVPPLIDAIEVAYERPRPRLVDLTLERDAAETTPAPVPSAFANGAELDLSRAVRPFGEQPAYDDVLYLECPEPLAAAGRLTLVVTVTNAEGKATPLPLVRLRPAIRWETHDGAAWRAVRSVSRADAFTVDGDVTMEPAAPSRPVEVGGRTAHWVRARLLGDYGAPAAYTTTKDAAGAWKAEYTPATLAPPLLADLGWRPLAVTRDRPRALVTRNADRVSVEAVPPGGALTAIRSEGGDGLVPYVGDVESDPALNLGFDRDFGEEPVTLFLPVCPPRPREVAGEGADAGPGGARLSVVWEYSGEQGWEPLAVVDGTEGFADRGTVRFVGPPDQVARTVAGRDAYWVRARVAGGDLPFQPRVRGVLPDTVWATEGTTVAEEILGNGTGTPGLELRTAHTPVLPGERLVVRADTTPATGAGAGAGEEVWTVWEAVTDLRSSGPDDRHFALDRLTGAIRFGDGLTGLVPPPGKGNIRIGYRYGGGVFGNTGAGTVTQLAVALPSVDAVVNHLPAEGGADRESLDDLRSRGSRSLRHRGRAVAAADFEDLAVAATPALARARAVPPRGYDPAELLWLDPARPKPTDAHTALRGGRAGVVVVPATGGDRPTPSPGLLDEVRAYLLARAPATADVWVAGPEWIGVAVVATVVPVPGAEPDALREAIHHRLRAFLHPLTGGAAGAGWDFGRKPHRSDLFALVRAVPGVSHLRQLTVRLTPEVGSEAFATRITDLVDRPLAAGVDETPDAEARRWLDRALVFSGDHEITMTLRD
ncbi:putative baseplate assembly protein [Frankia sp. CNm7]|uniref:Baseplate assembly protein n=1 Tax=Frankia nepalensis TaxID=1836974 RepID=A0A937R5W6_9ACTN|nr:putative baseplate assembly protein [Frankia nepalensis]MBL7494830.1 putative baseplate assembly protein [Frankia nepalensis]MBL7508979.1 putative baseplate assembly protein [Frankia nepalensis]MBL7524781.1 putative baseplate assembly protein [Frankia nepalensis]MBL7626313.1 putative baseplate assembly protein [Frankia nepalensis]